jgi:hypothetical protein
LENFGALKSQSGLWSAHPHPAKALGQRPAGNYEEDLFSNDTWQKVKVMTLTGQRLPS